MKVSELIARLRACPEDWDVLIPANEGVPGYLYVSDVRSTENPYKTHITGDRELHHGRVVIISD